MSRAQLKIYRGCTPVVDTRYDRNDDQSPTVQIVEAIATAEGVAADELPPLFDTIEPDALNQLFATDDGETLLSFQLDTWNVFVHGDGRIRVCDATEQTEPEPVFENGMG